MIRYPGCISFARSLDIMHIRDVPGAYGVDTQEYTCEMCWDTRMRDGWLQELINAQTEIEKELHDDFLCPREICDEVHAAAHEVRLKHPIYALGRWAYTEWQTATVTYTDLADDESLLITSMGQVEICDTSLVIDGETYDIADIEFDFPTEIAECYRGFQEIQEPCAVGHFDESVGCPAGGYRFQWNVYQLVNPMFNPDTPNTCVALTDTDSFLTEIRYRFAYVDDTNPISRVGRCSCGDCAINSLTAEIQDAAEGIICLGGSLCYGELSGRIKIDYISSYRCADRPDPALEKAVVVYAISMAGDSIAKPCECDNNWVEQWGKIDESTRGDTPIRYRFGTTVGGMAAMRTVNRFLAQDSARKSRTAIPLISRGRPKAFLSRFG